MSRPPTRYGISARVVLCSGRSPQPSGSGYRDSVVFPHAGGNHSAARLGLPVTRLVCDAPPAVLPLFCSLVPNPRAAFLDAFRIPWGNLGVYAFPPFLSSDGWWLESERPQSLHDSGRPLCLVKEWFADLPLPLFVVFPVFLCRGKGFSVSPIPGSQSALHSVFSLQDLVRATSRKIFYVP